MNYYTLKTMESWLRMPREYVSVDFEKLQENALCGAKEALELPAWDVSGVYPRDNRAFLTHIFWENTINFAFTHFRGSRRDGKPIKFEVRSVTGERMRGAFAMDACFYRAFGEHPIYARDMWRHCETLSRLKKFFQGYTSIPMLRARRELLLEACSVLERDFSGNPWNIWEEGKFHAYGTRRDPGIVDILFEKFPKTFRDYATLQSKGGVASQSGLVRLPNTLEFFFNKRANLVVMMYHDRAEYFPVELPYIQDIHALGPAPDYVLPQTYWSDGIFQYSEALEEIIASRKRIPAGSKMELEIRGATVFAQVNELQLQNEERERLGLPPRHIGHIDFWRWQRARSVRGNHHLCMTTAY